MKKLFLLVALLAQFVTHAQELYPNSEPASIVPKNALGIRLMNEAYMNGNNFRSWHGAMFMYALSPKLMFNAMVTTSNHHSKVLPNDFIQKDSTQTDYVNQSSATRNYNYAFESVNLGFRYRFLNKDGDHKHFRMALYGNGVYTGLPHDEAEVSLMGDNKAVGGGIISTVLVKKLAISLTGGIIKPFDYKGANSVSLRYGNAYNYSLSFGYLVYPFKYKNYQQTNINLYAEFIGKSYSRLDVVKNGQAVNLTDANEFKGGNYLELRPAIQFIVKSNLRIDCSTAIPLVNRSYIRKYPMYLLNLQYYFFL